MKALLLVIALVAEAEAPKTLLPEVPAVRAAESPRVAEFPAPLPVDACSFANLLRKRFLSGAWSAARRLEAAKLRGDAEEVKRMEAALDVLIDEATVLEGP